jgi:DNA-binding transcriptional ArsR family regulator
MKALKDNCVICDKRQMRALAAATRQEIVDVLPRMGTVSVAELAAALGRPADALYFHLRILERVGLIRRAGSRPATRRRETLFRAVGPELSLSYQPGKKGNAREVNAIIASMLRLGIRDFRNAFQDFRSVVSGAHRELWAARRTAWLSRSQIARVNRYIHRLMREMAAPRRDGRLYAVTLVLTPLARQPRSRSRLH